MSKKQDAFYYDNFAACAELARKATHFLKEKLTAFDPAKMEENMEEIHRIEHEADEKKHQLTDRLAKAFITPIEREDIISLSYNIDELTDKAEEVFIRIYMNNVQTIRPDALRMLDIVIACTEEVCAVIQDTHHSATLIEGVGLYNGEPCVMVYSVVENSQVRAIAQRVRETDPRAFVNVVHTQRLVGRFYRRPRD